MDLCVVSALVWLAYIGSFIHMTLSLYHTLTIEPCIHMVTFLSCGALIFKIYDNVAIAICMYDHGQ